MFLIHLFGSYFSILPRPLAPDHLCTGVFIFPVNWPIFGSALLSVCLFWLNARVQSPQVLLCRVCCLNNILFCGLKKVIFENLSHGSALWVMTTANRTNHSFPLSLLCCSGWEAASKWKFSTVCWFPQTLLLLIIYNVLNLNVWYYKNKLNGCLNWIYDFDLFFFSFVHCPRRLLFWIGAVKINKLNSVNWVKYNWILRKAINDFKINVWTPFWKLKKILEPFVFILVHLRWQIFRFDLKAAI